MAETPRRRDVIEAIACFLRGIQIGEYALYSSLAERFGDQQGRLHDLARAAIKRVEHEGIIFESHATINVGWKRLSDAEMLRDKGRTYRAKRQLARRLTTLYSASPEKLNEEERKEHTRQCIGTEMAISVLAPKTQRALVESRSPNTLADLLRGDS